MADTSDVEAALVALIAAACNGLSVKVFRGWPIPAQLDADLAAGIVSISVYPSDVESNVTRHHARWDEWDEVTPTLILSVEENRVIVSGIPDTYNAAVFADGRPYVLRVWASDSHAAIAAGLAALIPGATLSGATLTVPGTHITARVGGFGSAVRELKRQKKGYQITLWCPNPESRDAVAPRVDAALAAAAYLPLPDGTAARLLYVRTRISDRAEKDNLYRRDLFYSAEFSTTESVEAARVVAEVLPITPL